MRNDDRYTPDAEDLDPMTEEDREAMEAEIRAINEEEGRNHPDLMKAKWAGMPQCSESEMDW